MLYLREGERHRERGRERELIRNWLKWLWRLRSPKICSQKVGTQESWWCNSSPRVGKDQCLNPINQVEEVPFYPASFVLLRSLTDWVRPVHNLHNNLHSALLIQMLISSRNTPRITSDQMSGQPMAQSNWHIKLTITLS